MSDKEAPITDTKEVDDIEAKDAPEREGLLNRSKMDLPPPDHESTRAPDPDMEVPLTPSEKVKSLLEDDDSVSLHGLFCQMDVLCLYEDGEYGWKEAARWLKYEEKVEMGDRWSKPHVATTSLHALYELRKGLEETTVVLDLHAPHGCNFQVGEMITDCIMKESTFTPDVGGKILEVLLKPHKHQHRRSLGKGERLESAMDVEKSGHAIRKRLPFSPREEQHTCSKYEFPEGMTAKSLKPYKPNKRLMQKIPKGTEAANILIGQVDFLLRPVMCFVRMLESVKLDDLTEVALPTRFIFLLLGPAHTTEIWEYEETGRAMALCFTDRVFCEVAYKASTRQDLLDGIDELIDDLTVLPPSIWDPATRLEPPETTTSETSSDAIRARMRGEPRRVAIKQSFQEDTHGVIDTGLKRTRKPFGGLIQDIKRRYPLYLSDIKDGLNIKSVATIAFMYFACITPIVTFGGLLGQATNQSIGTMETLMAGAICGCIYHLFAGQPLTIVGATGPLLIFEMLLYHLCHDTGTDFLSFRFYIGMWITVALVLCVAFDLSAFVRHITRFTEESFAVLIALIFIWEAFRKLFGIWWTHPIHFRTVDEGPHAKCRCVPPENTTVAAATLSTPVTSTTPPVVIPRGNLSGPLYYVQNMTKPDTTIRPNWTQLMNDDCVTLSNHIVVSRGCISEEDCRTFGYSLFGAACEVEPVHSVPDVFFLCCFLFIGTFVFALLFRYFRNSCFLPSFVRYLVSDFAVLLAIIIWTVVDVCMGLETPKLQVPATFETTQPGRGWVVNPGSVTYWWLPLVAIFPAALATILIFLDQQITAVIINRQEHKLKKGHGYHLDLAAMTVGILISSIMGLPWFVAATIRSIAHVRSLMVESELRAPGERVQFLGVREQRVTGFVVHILIGVSVLFTPVLRYVPMAVLYGVFLYMGVTAFYGIQFAQRFDILFMPRKYQADLIYLRHVSTKRVHLFTGIQILCLAIMFIVKSIKQIAILFPLLVMALVYVRKGLNYVFSQQELQWLDHILPCDLRRKKEDEEKEIAKEEKQQVKFMDRLRQKNILPLHVKEKLHLRDPTKKGEEISMAEFSFGPLPDDSTKAALWNTVVAKRDYGLGRAYRPRSKSLAIIDRYAKKKHGEDSQDEEAPSAIDSHPQLQAIPVDMDESRRESGTTEPWRDRKFTL